MSVRKVIEVIIGGRSELNSVVDKANADLARLGKGVPGAGGAGRGLAGGADGAMAMLKTTNDSLSTMHKMVRAITLIETGFTAAARAADVLNFVTARAAGNTEAAEKALEGIHSISKIPIIGKAFDLGQDYRSWLTGEPTTAENEEIARRQLAENQADIDRQARLQRDQQARAAFEKVITDRARAAMKKTYRESELAGMTPQLADIARLKFAEMDELDPLLADEQKASARGDERLLEVVRNAIKRVQDGYRNKLTTMLAKQAADIQEDVDKIIDDVQAAGRDQLRQRARDELAKAMDLRSTAAEMDLYFPEDAEDRELAEALARSGDAPTRRPDRLGPLGATMLSGSYRGVGELFTAGLDPQAALLKVNEAQARDAARTAKGIEALLEAVRGGARMPAPFNLSLR
jgi:gas vesicle protein